MWKWRTLGGDLLSSVWPYDSGTRYNYIFYCSHMWDNTHYLNMTTLNDLDIKSADVLNTYLVAPKGEKVGTTYGPEFGGDTGKTTIIVRALSRGENACVV